MRICLTLVFVTVSFKAYTLAYPSAPGTCNVDKMAIVGHGPSKSTCLDCYGVQITPSIDNFSAPTVDIQLTGRYAFQGILLLVKEKATNKTVGEFISFDEERLTSVACDDDDEPDYAHLDFDRNTVIGHIDPKLKEWPVTLSWTMVEPVDKPLTELKLQGMVVLDYDNFHILPETEFKIKQKTIEPTISITTDNIDTTGTPEATSKPILVEPSVTQGSGTKPAQTVIEIEHGKGTIVHQETNALFMKVLSIFVCTYFVLSICHRQFAKRRTGVSPLPVRQSVEAATTTNHQLQADDAIPLVSIKSMVD